MATERTQLEKLRAEWVERLKLAVEHSSIDAIDWLLAHGEPKRNENHPELVVLEIRDRFRLGHALTLTCGPGELTARMDDEHGRTFSYHGDHKFKQLIRVTKGWGVMFIDDFRDGKNTVLTISERATFELHESGGEVLLEQLYGR